LKDIIKKILKEEFDELGWMKSNSIDAKELQDLLIKTKATSIPFEHVDGDLELRGTEIKDLGNLQSVDGDLFLYGTEIKSLGNLQSVGGWLYLHGTEIKSLGNLQYVGGELILRKTPLAKAYSEEEIRSVVNVDGNIYM
jgi:hypothetical protein